MSLGGGGDFEKGKRDPNEPKVIFLLIKKHSFLNICARSGPPQLGVVLVFIIFETVILLMKLLILNLYLLLIEVDVV